MVMSAITVRANMRMLFDQQSANKAQSDYMGRLSRMEKMAAGSLRKSNDELVADFNRTVKQLEEKDNAANERMRKNSERITKQVQANAKAAQHALKPDASMFASTKKGLAAYVQHEKAYRASLRSMEMANNKYAASAKKLGIAASTGQFDAGTFAGNTAAQRGQGIALMRKQLSLTDQTTEEYRQGLIILQMMEETHEMITFQERILGQELSKNAKKRMLASRQLDKGIMSNNQKFREQMRLLGQINASYSRMTQQMTGAFMNALLASTVALMTFGFRLQAVVDTFQQFEKELMNAQSIFQTTNEVLFGLSDQIVEFGTRYGISLGTASEGLYTLASAGLSANDSQQVLQNTLKLSMAVQGDHETIAKLTTQTIFGFGLQMSESAELTDKFAHAINMSLIEYQDLASAVKFAMPFFVSTNQNVDQLLGSLQVLTNRALEAGIAGRGLRQALAEFAQHAEDNTAAFAKMGVEITNADGSFKLLTEIAREFSEAMGPAASDVDLMTTLLEDLNVRGATAFVHLVQNVDEFEGAVSDLSNSAGSATRMADIQQKSLANQIQVVKNALMAPFLLSDEVGRANGTMNTFGESLHNIVENFESFFIVTLPDGTKNLTKMGQNLRDTVIVVLEELGKMIRNVLRMFSALNDSGNNIAGMFGALMIPLNLLVGAITLLGSDGVKTVLMFKAMNAILPFTELHIMGNVMAQILLNEEETKGVAIKGILLGAQLALNIGLLGGLYLLNQESQAMKNLGIAVLFAAGAYAAYTVAKAASVNPLAAAAVGGTVTASIGYAMNKVMTPPDLPTYDMGGRIMYDTGGGLGNRHFPVLVEPGETIIPKTQNMLSGGGGITLNIQGDIVTNDADDFAERIAVALPEALRRQNDIGGI
jgi:TP901 family phage tail tape measure protein